MIAFMFRFANGSKGGEMVMTAFEERVGSGMVDKFVKTVDDTLLEKEDKWSWSFP